MLLEKGLFDLCKSLLYLTPKKKDTHMRLKMYGWNKIIFISFNLRVKTYLNELQHI